MKRRTLLKHGALLAMMISASKHSNAMDDRGFYVPPEDAPHQCTFMQWPASRRIYGDDGFLELVQDTIAEIANAIAEFEPVVLLATKSEHRKIKRLITSNIEVWDIATEDLWCRDSGPLFAKSADGELVVSHIQFNGWGNKQTHKLDAKVAEQIANRLGMELISSGIVGEAGGIDHDSHGLLLAHESSWINPNRNPHLTKKQISERLIKAYGADRIIWAPGLKGQDITDYHIDSLARFTGPGQLLMNLPQVPDPYDPFHQTALKTYDILKNENLDLEVIPEPQTQRVKHRDYVASYANFYACNGAVIAAQFGDQETDEIAHDALRRHYPGREIVMLNVDALGEIGGGIHCATQQMPNV